MEYVSVKDKILFVIQEYSLPSRIILVPHREFMLHRRDEYNLIKEKCKVKWLECPEQNKRLFPAKVMYKKVIWGFPNYSSESSSKGKNEEITGVDEDSPISDAYNLLLYYFSISPYKKPLLALTNDVNNLNLNNLDNLSFSEYSSYSSNNYSSISSSTDSLPEIKSKSNIKEENIKDELEKYLDEKDVFWVNKCKFFLGSNNDHLLNYILYKKMEDVSEAYLFLEN